MFIGVLYKQYKQYPPYVRCCLFWLVCLLLFWADGSLPIHAQAPTTQISGTVVDPAGHILPGVVVTLESVEGGPPTIDTPATSVVASTITSETGQFEWLS